MVFVKEFLLFLLLLLAISLNYVDKVELLGRSLRISDDKSVQDTNKNHFSLTLFLVYIVLLLFSGYAHVQYKMCYYYRETVFSARQAKRKWDLAIQQRNHLFECWIAERQSCLSHGRFLYWMKTQLTLEVIIFMTLSTMMLLFGYHSWTCSDFESKFKVMVLCAPLVVTSHILDKVWKMYRVYTSSRMVLQSNYRIHGINSVVPNFFELMFLHILERSRNVELRSMYVYSIFVFHVHLERSANR